MFRTTAFARTMPPGTSKTRVRSVPTRSVMDPQRNRPPMLNVLTRETCCWPLPYQVADMPCGKEIRGWRRGVPPRVSAIIRQGKGTMSIGGEPIEQKFLSASTLEKLGVHTPPLRVGVLNLPQGRVLHTPGVIVKDPNILGGTPVFRGTRAPIQALKVSNTNKI
jgi:uncharacterized protein DUF433